MKNIYIFLVGILIFFTRCEKEEKSFNENNNITNDIEKVETIYKEGDIKNENFFDGNKGETTASYSLKEKIRIEIEKSYSKSRTYLKSGSNLVGVIKNGSCGGWKELDIFMDCEDSNPNSSSSGWIGDNYIDSRKNVHLKFCVVYNAYFEHTNVDFAVLNLTTNLPWGIS